MLDPISTWMSLGTDLPTWDLTAVADRIISGTLARAPIATLDELVRAIEAAGSIPGVVALRRSLEEARVGAWSRPETLLRILIVRAGLPEPELNVPVGLADGRTAIPDLAWPGLRIAIEYDGRQHSGRWEQDADGHERLADEGWVVIRIRASELFVTPSAVIARLVRRLAARGVRATSIDWSKMPRFVP